MSSIEKPKDPKDDPNHIPVEKRLSGDFGSPLEVMASTGLGPDQKRAILRTWLDDVAAQPKSAETDAVRDSIHEALQSLEGEAERRRER